MTVLNSLIYVTVKVERNVVYRGVEVYNYG